MSKYSFLEECDNLDRCAREMREALRKVDLYKAHLLCFELQNAGARLLRKIDKYEEYVEWAQSVASWGTIQKPLDDYCGK